MRCALAVPLVCALCLALVAAATQVAAVEDESSLTASEEEESGTKPAEDEDDEEDEEEEEEEDEDEALRERLTEREDKRRPRKPWGFEVGGRRLTVSGEYELELLGLRSDPRRG